MRRFYYLAGVVAFGACSGSSAPPVPPTTAPSTTAPPTLPPTTAVSTTVVAPPTTTTRASRARRADPPEGNGGAMAQELARIAACESGSNPRAVSRSGRHRGKYQFDQRTWNGVGGEGDPAEASEGEQDARAARLYAERGAQPWPTCGR